MPGIVTDPNAPCLVTDQRVRVQDGFVISTSVGRVSSGTVVDLPLDELRAMVVEDPRFVREHFEDPGVPRVEYPSGCTAADYDYDQASRAFTPKPRVRTDGQVTTPPPPRVFWARAAPKRSLNEPLFPWEPEAAAGRFSSGRGF